MDGIEQAKLANRSRDMLWTLALSQLIDEGEEALQLDPEERHPDWRNYTQEFHDANVKIFRERRRRIFCGYPGIVEQIAEQPVDNLDPERMVFGRLG